MSKGDPARAHAFIAGEPELVEEYATACAGAGIDVTTRFNPGRTGALPHAAVRRRKVSPRTTIGIELTNTFREDKRRNLADLDAALAPGILILSSSVATTVAEQAQWMRTPARLIGISALPSLLHGGLVELAPFQEADRSLIGSAQEFYRKLGKETSIVQDSPGMIMPRILCMLVNEACFALGEKIASRGDIDAAMKLGAHYPSGPLEWGERLGIRQVRAVLAGLQRDLGEERYRTAPLLLRTYADKFPRR